jgi:hypothetical protein
MSLSFFSFIFESPYQLLKTAALKTIEDSRLKEQSTDTDDLIRNTIEKIESYITSFFISSIFLTFIGVAASLASLVSPITIGSICLLKSHLLCISTFSSIFDIASLAMSIFLNYKLTNFKDTYARIYQVSIWQSFKNNIQAHLHGMNALEYQLVNLNS